MRRGAIGAWLALAGFVPPALAADLRIVAAENFYGDVAAQIAGPAAGVSSILSNPDQDPHLFEASPSTARALANARIVIANGAGYDPWMQALLGASPAPGRRVIVVADLVHRQAGDNPHLWYDPATMPAAATAIAAALAEADPARKSEYDGRLQTFLHSLQPLTAEIAALRRRFAGTPVAATEPVFGYMAAAIGLATREENFQRAVMNDTEPAAGDIAAFESDLRTHAVRLLIYNRQAATGAAGRMLQLAQRAGVPVVGVSETEPAGQSYQAWMADQLQQVDRALSRPAP